MKGTKMKGTKIKDIDITKIRQLLKQAKDTYGQSRSCGYYLINKEKYDQALGLLPCGTCNGTKQVPTPRSVGFGHENEIMDTCPDCQPKLCETCGGKGTYHNCDWAGCSSIEHVDKSFPCPDCQSKPIPMPTDDDRRSEGYKWCEILGHGWYFGTCPDCCQIPKKSKVVSDLLTACETLRDMLRKPSMLPMLDREEIRVLYRAEATINRVQEAKKDERIR